MRAFLIQHIDALIPIVVGLWLSIYAWRRRDRLRASSNPLVRVLPFLAPMIVLVGVVQLVVHSPPALAWQHAITDDERASAEFPCAPETRTTTDTWEGISVQRVTMACNIRQRSIDLRLSYSEIPPEGAGLSAEDHISWVKLSSEQEGFTILSSELEPYGDTPGYRLLIGSDDGQMRSVIRVAITPEVVCHISATSVSGYHDDAAIARFVNSFQVHQ